MDSQFGAVGAGLGYRRPAAVVAYCAGLPSLVGLPRPVGWRLTQVGRPRAEPPARRGVLMAMGPTSLPVRSAAMVALVLAAVLSFTVTYYGLSQPFEESYWSDVRGDGFAKISVSPRTSLKSLVRGVTVRFGFLASRASRQAAGLRPPESEAAIFPLHSPFRVTDRVARKAGTGLATCACSTWVDLAFSRALLRQRGRSRSG